MPNATTTKQEFKPNRLTFQQGVERVQKAIKEVGKPWGGRIVTSRDPTARQLCKALRVDNVPKGFQKWQLPFVMEPSQLFISVANPDLKVGRHSHDEGDGIRFIVSGSITYEGTELTAGDWMFIPKGQPYSFEVGPMGAVMCYCYCCCCA